MFNSVNRFHIKLVGDKWKMHAENLALFMAAKLGARPIETGNI